MTDRKGPHPELGPEVVLCPFDESLALHRGDFAWCNKCGAFMERTGQWQWIAWKHEAHPEYLKALRGDKR